MSVYIFFNKDNNVFICKAYQYTISAKYMTRHFLKEHDLITIPIGNNMSVMDYNVWTRIYLHHEKYFVTLSNDIK